MKKGIIKILKTTTVSGWFIKTFLPFALKVCAVASTYAEMKNLVGAAVTYRLVTGNIAHWRYGLIALMEVLSTLLFMQLFEFYILKANEDHKITRTETLIIFVKTFPFFLLAFFFTSGIHLLYLEAIGSIEMQFETINFFTSMFPILGSYIETNCDNFLHGDCTTIGQIELGAVALVYTTPMISILLVAYMVFLVIPTINRKFEEEHVEDIVEDKESDEKDDNEDDHDNKLKKNLNPNFEITGLRSVVPLLKKLIHQFNEIAFEKSIAAYCGIDPDDPRRLKESPTTHFSVKQHIHWVNNTDPKKPGAPPDGSRSPEAALKILTNSLLGSRTDEQTEGSHAPVPYRQIKGLQYYYEQMLEFVKEVQTLDESVAELYKTCITQVFELGNLGANTEYPKQIGKYIDHLPNSSTGGSLFDNKNLIQKKIDLQEGLRRFTQADNGIMQNVLNELDVVKENFKSFNIEYK